MNLSLRVGDELDAVGSNRALLAALAGAEPRWLDQVHGARAVAAEMIQAFDVLQKADASYTDVPGVVCAVLVADCLPILICDDLGTQVAVVHAGWRGLAEGVVENSVHAFGAASTRLMAYLGPCIGPTAFEVGADVRAAYCDRDAAASAAFVDYRAGKWLCDLPLLARQRLGKLGIDRVYGGTRCTYRESQHFYSYRREPATGRMAALIWLKAHAR